MEEDFEILPFFSDLESGVYDFKKPEHLNGKESISKCSKKVGGKRKRVLKVISLIILGYVLAFSRIRPALSMGLTILPPTIVRVQPSSHQRIVSSAKIIPSNVHIEPNPGSLIVAELPNKKMIEMDENFFREVIRLSRGGSDEALIRSILSKLSESGVDEISFCKMLMKLGPQVENIVNEIGPIIFNKDLMRILAELEKPMKASTLGVIPVGERLKMREAPKSSSSVFVEGFNFPRFSSRHKRQPGKIDLNGKRKTDVLRLL